MPSFIGHRCTYRVIYGDTDKMGVVYHANYFRWFEIGRSEMFRDLGLTYKQIEAKGIFLPVSEAFCKFVSPVQYDDFIIIETIIDSADRAGVKFDYIVFDETGETTIAKGYTRHACVNENGRVTRPPAFLKDALAKKGQ
ncbi:thioesterase family protein [Desulfobacterales bacterium HSG16]|nr:thioesterase family protein [Desulfobacterales bacterium HSG16]